MYEFFLRCNFNVDKEDIFSIWFSLIKYYRECEHLPYLSSSWDMLAVLSKKVFIDWSGYKVYSVKQTSDKEIIIHYANIIMSAFLHFCFETSIFNWWTFD